MSHDLNRHFSKHNQLHRYILKKEMETQRSISEKSLSRPSLELLDVNDDCILHIFKYLELRDAVYLAETCQRLRVLANNVYKKNSKVTIAKFENNYGESIDEWLEWGILYNRPDYFYMNDIPSLNLVFRHIGQYVLSLEILFSGEESALTALKSIMDHITSLKTLIVLGMKDRSVVPRFACLANVEMLSLDCCDLLSWFDAFKFVRKLKILNIRSTSNMGCMDWKDLFQNNSDIESLCVYDDYDGNSVDIRLLQLLPKLSNLFLSYSDSIYPNISTSEFNSLLPIQQLTKVKLSSNHTSLHGRNLYLSYLHLRGKVFWKLTGLKKYISAN